ncbi:MAG: sigma factor-like helix-turn-helix DNA-binding protein [Candidatus Kapaibacterium sp.]
MLWKELEFITTAIRRATLSRFTGISAEQISDAVHDARSIFFEKFYTKGDIELPLDPPAAYSWIALTATRALLREQGRRRRMIYVPFDYDPDTDYPRDVGHEALEAVRRFGQSPEASWDAVLTLEALMERLSPVMAEVVREHDIRGETLQGVAGRMGCTLSAAKQRHRRALLKMKDVER